MGIVVFSFLWQIALCIIFGYGFVKSDYRVMLLAMFLGAMVRVRISLK